MKSDIKPQGAVYVDNNHLMGEQLYESFQKTEDLEELRKSAEHYSNSEFIEGAKFSGLIFGQYYLLSARGEKNASKKSKLYLKSMANFEKILGNSDEVKKIRAEYLKHKMRNHGKANHPKPKLFRQLAESLKEIGDTEGYHAEMALHYMFSLKEDDLFSDSIDEPIRKMLEHAKQSGHRDMVLKTKALSHQIRSRKTGSFSETAEELRSAVEATHETSDKYGLDELETRLMFSEAMLKSQSQRNEILVEVANRWRRLGNKKEELLVRKLLSPVPVNVIALLDMADSTLKKLESLNKQIHLNREIKPGPYRLFYHHGLLVERIKDLRIVIERLGKNRKRITELSIRENKYRPKKIRHGKPISKRLQKIANETHQLKSEMKLDMEILYIYSNLALDQWAHMIWLLTGSEGGEKYPFHELTMALQKKGDKGHLEKFSKNHLTDVVWVYYQIRMFRNVFVEHARDPWQRGSTMGVLGDDFRLFFPAPVGWVTKDEMNQIINDLKKSVPSWLNKALGSSVTEGNPRMYLEIVYNNIDKIPKQNSREQVWNAWKKLGGSVPSYDRLGFRLFKYLNESISTVTVLVSENPSLVNLGGRRAKKQLQS